MKKRRWCCGCLNNNEHNRHKIQKRTRLQRSNRASLDKLPTDYYRRIRSATDGAVFRGRRNTFQKQNARKSNQLHKPLLNRAPTVKKQTNDAPLHSDSSMHEPEKKPPEPAVHDCAWPSSNKKLNNTIVSIISCCVSGLPERRRSWLRSCSILCWTAFGQYQYEWGDCNRGLY